MPGLTEKEVNTVSVSPGFECTDPQPCALCEKIVQAQQKVKEAQSVRQEAK